MFTTCDIVAARKQGDDVKGGSVNCKKLEAGGSAVLTQLCAGRRHADDMTVRIVAMFLVMLLGVVPARAVSTSADVDSRKLVGLTVSLISPRGVEQTKADWSLFVDDLARKLKMPITMRVGKNQRDVAADILEGRADIAWLGNSPALEVVELGVAEVFAAMVRSDGTSGYRSVIVVKKDSPILTLEDLLDARKSRSFAMGDPSSTSGYVVPNYYAFARNKVRPETIFHKVLTGNHLQNALSVASGEVDAGTCNDSELQSLKARNFTQYEKLRVLWQSVEIPESPMVWRKTLDPQLKLRIGQFFTSYGSNAAQQEVLKKINGLKRFRASSNRQLLLIADIEMFNARTQIDRNASLTVDERGIRHQDVVRRAVRLETALRMQ